MFICYNATSQYINFIMNESIINELIFRCASLLITHTQCPILFSFATLCPKYSTFAFTYLLMKLIEFFFCASQFFFLRVINLFLLHFVLLLIWYHTAKQTWIGRRLFIIKKKNKFLSCLQEIYTSKLAKNRWKNLCRHTNQNNKENPYTNTRMTFEQYQFAIKLFMLSLHSRCSWKALVSRISLDRRCWRKRRKSVIRWTAYGMVWMNVVFYEVAYWFDYAAY